MSEIEKLIQQLRSIIDDKDRQIDGLAAERDRLRGVIGEYQAEKQKDNDRISELLVEVIDLRNKLKGLA